MPPLLRLLTVSVRTKNPSGGAALLSSTLKYKGSARARPPLDSDRTLSIFSVAVYRYGRQRRRTAAPTRRPGTRAVAAASTLRPGARRATPAARPPTPGADPCPHARRPTPCADRSTCSSSRPSPSAPCTGGGSASGSRRCPRGCWS